MSSSASASGDSFVEGSSDDEPSHSEAESDQDDAAAGGGARGLQALLWAAVAEALERRHDEDAVARASAAAEAREHLREAPAEGPGARQGAGERTPEGGADAPAPAGGPGGALAEPARLPGVPAPPELRLAQLVEEAEATEDDGGALAPAPERAPRPAAQDGGPAASATPRGELQSLVRELTAELSRSVERAQAQHSPEPGATPGGTPEQVARPLETGPTPELARTPEPVPAASDDEGSALSSVASSASALWSLLVGAADALARGPRGEGYAAEAPAPASGRASNSAASGEPAGAALPATPWAPPPAAGPDGGVGASGRDCARQAAGAGATSAGVDAGSGGGGLDDPAQGSEAAEAGAAAPQAEGARDEAPAPGERVGPNSPEVIAAAAEAERGAEEEAAEETESTLAELASKAQCQAKHLLRVTSQVREELMEQTSEAALAKEAAEQLEQSLRTATFEKELLQQEMRQAAEEAKVELAARIRCMEGEHERLLDESAARCRLLEERTEEHRVSEESARSEAQEALGACLQAERALKSAEEELSRRERAAVMRWMEQESRRGPCILGRCTGRRWSAETQALHARLNGLADESRRREAEMRAEAEGEAAARAHLEGARLRAREAEAGLAAQAAALAWGRFEDEERAEEAARQSERDEALAREAEAEAELAQRRERAAVSVGPLSGLPLSVRVPAPPEARAPQWPRAAGFEVVVRGVGCEQTLTKRLSDIKDLHGALSRRPFAPSLPAPPQDRSFAPFCAGTPARQLGPEQLEAYLSSLCVHSGVLMDATIWEWLEMGELTQAVVRLLAASTMQWPAETGRAACLLDRAVASCSAAALCLQPEVVEVLREVLRDPADGDAQAAACRTLDRLLASSAPAWGRAFPQGSAGASALLAVARGPHAGAGDAAAETLRRALESCGREEDAADAGLAERARGEVSPPAVGGGGQRLGECCICMNGDKSHALLPCGHLCVCGTCAASLRRHGNGCPVCRRRIDQIVQIFT